MPMKANELGKSKLELLALSIYDNQRRPSTGSIGSNSADSVASDGIADMIDVAPRAGCMKILCQAGYDIGFNYIRKMAQKTPIINFGPSEAISFICKSFWFSLFGRKLQRLETDNSGNYLCSDFDFTWLQPDRFLKRNAAYELLAFPCGAITGALACLGFRATVEVDRRGRTAVEFVIHLTEE